MSDTSESLSSDLLYQRRRARLEFESRRDLQRGYEAMAGDPRLRHFVRIPGRILRSLDRLGVACEHNEAQKRLAAFYLFIGVVDDAIDTGQIGIGEMVLARLSGNLSVPPPDSRVCVATEILKQHVGNDSQFLDTLRELEQAVIRERGTGTIQEYLRSRRAVGSLTAELTYLLIRPSLDREREELRAFMKEVGALGCLVDSVIDLSTDYHDALIGFRPGVGDHAQLLYHTMKDGLRLALAHPQMIDLFLWAIFDIVLDHPVRNRGGRERTAVTRRKDEATGVV
jgi:hypothetical protein